VVGPSGLEVDADPEHRHVVRLDADPEPDVDPLTGDRVLEISWHPADALPFPLCLDQFPVPGGVVRGASVARGNVVLADHGLTGAPEPLPPVPETGRYAPVLARPGLTFRMPYDDETARAAPASAATAVDVHLTVPAIRLSQGADRWEPQRDLLSSDRFANEFVVETESDGRAGLRFGDDVLGRRPTPGAAFRAQYRVGNGAAGNVGREALGRLVTNLRDFDRVGNPVAAAGGTEPESLEEVRQFAPQAFRRQERAVTEADYAEVAERHPEIQRAAATRRWTGSWYTEFVAVDRRGGYGVDERFAAALAGFLEPFRMAGRDVEVDGPVDVPLDIAMTVCVEPDQLRADVQRALLEAFGRGQLPGGGRGFFHPDNFTFGQPVYLSRVVARAMDVPGVQWVDTSEGPDSANRFQRWGQDSHGERDAGVIEMGRLEVARLDNDPDAPEEGRIEFVMQGGLG